MEYFKVYSRNVLSYNGIEKESLKQLSKKSKIKSTLRILNISFPEEKYGKIVIEVGIGIKYKGCITLYKTISILEVEFIDMYDLMNGNEGQEEFTEFIVSLYVKEHNQLLKRVINIIIKEIPEFNKETTEKFSIKNSIDVLYTVVKAIQEYNFSNLP